MILQILSDGSVSPSWLFGSLITVILLTLGYMLKRNLERIEEIIEKHDKQINNQHTDIEILKYSHGDTIKMSQKILDKLSYLNGPE